MPTPLRAEGEAGFTASRRSEAGELALPISRAVYSGSHRRLTRLCVCVGLRVRWWEFRGRNAIYLGARLSEHPDFRTVKSRPVNTSNQLYKRFMTAGRFPNIGFASLCHRCILYIRN